MLNYLNSRGYTDAALELQKEMDINKAATNEDMVNRMGIVDPKEECLEEEERQKTRVATREIMKSKVIASLIAQNTLSSEDLVMFSFVGEEAEHLNMYSAGYDTYRSWALNSLDQIKTELLSLCFPLFVTSYISLVRKNALAAARLFWDQWSGDFADLYAPELQFLSIITSPEQLDESPQGDFHKQCNFNIRCVKSKFKCVISTLAFGLLTTFLAQNDLLLPASIINDHVQFVRVERAPHLTDAGSGLLLELPGYTQVSAVPRSQLPNLFLGVAGKGLRNNTVQMPPFLHDEVFREWLKTIVLRNLFVSAAKVQQIGGGGSSNSSGGGSSLSSFWKSKVDRGPLGDALEPSVLFATLTNAHEGMVCMEINRSAEQAVGGFRDNSVRVWSLAGKAFKGPVSGLGGGSGSGGSGTTFEVLGTKRAAPSSSSSANIVPSAQLGDVDGHRQSSLPVLVFRGHAGPVYGVSQEQASTGGRLVLSGSSDHTVRLWDTHVQQTVGKYRSAAAVWDVSFCPIGYYFATASADRTVGVYSTDRMTPVRFMAGHGADTTCIAWHPNSTALMSGSDDKTVILWDIRSGKCQRVLRGSPSAISCVCVAPQGDRVAVGTDTGSVHVWDLNSGQQLGLLQGHRGAVHSVAFSENGEAMSSGGADYTVRTWDMDELLPPKGSIHDAPPLHSTVPIYRPAQSFHTKFTPAFCVAYSQSNLLLAGGPYSLSAAGLERSAWMSEKSEEEVITALGLSCAQKS